MKPRLVSVEEQQELIPDDAIREAFMEREDVMCLSEDEQERRWQEHVPKIRQLQRRLSELPGFVVR